MRQLDPAHDTRHVSKVFKQRFASVAWVWRTIAKLVDMRAAVLFVVVLLLLSGKGSFSFN